MLEPISWILNNRHLNVLILTVIPLMAETLKALMMVNLDWEYYLVTVRGEISISSYNCNSLADYKKRRSVFKWLKEKEYNIYCLQKTKSTSLDEAAWKKEWGGEIIFCHGQRNPKGVMILTNKNVDLIMQIVRNDSQERWIYLNMKVD